MRKKLIKGRYLSGLKYSSSKNYILISDNNNFIEISPKPISISQSYKIGCFNSRIRISNVCIEESSMHHRNFVFLPYIPGKITYVRQTGYDILSGDMTGCLIVRFLMKGAIFVGHIGTYDTPSSLHSTQVREAWMHAVNRGEIELLDWYDPVDHLPPSAFTSTDNWLASYFAIVDRSGRFYTAIMSRDLTSNSDDEWRIANTYRMNGRGPIAIF